MSYSDRWTELADAAGVRVRPVDVYAGDFLDQLAGCDGFLWRFLPHQRQIAQRVLPAVELGMGLPVFPSFRSVWHYDDKVTQHYLLAAAGIPTPRSWTFWGARAARAFARDAAYPLVFKLALGWLAENVRLVRTPEEALAWIDRMFGPGVRSLQEPLRPPSPTLRQRVGGAARALLGRPAGGRTGDRERGYFYVQEFLPDNAFDTRVTVFGNRAVAFRRMNRPGDFRASGSGRIDWDPGPIDLATVRLGFRVAKALGMPTLAVDGLRRGDEPVVGEVSYTSAAWAVRKCPGHWHLDGDPQTGALEWVPGELRPEDAIFEDFLAEVARRRRPGSGGPAAPGPTPEAVL